jgi:MFS family permease
VSNIIPLETAEKSRVALRKIYFILGIGVMAWVPRFPELQDQLDISASYFGFLISFGSGGAILAYAWMGHFVHHWGAKPTMYVFGVITYVFMTLVTFTSSPFLFQILVVVFTAALVAYNVALNAQTILIQRSLNRPVLGQFHGSWSAGALLTSGLSGLIALLIPLQIHLLILSMILLPIAIWQTAKLTDTKPTADEENPTQPKTPIPPIWRAPKLQWILSIGMTCGILIDVVGADWLTIYTHEHLGVPTGPDAIPITLFMLAVIIGRLNTDRVAQAIGMDNLVRISGYVGFLGGIIAIAGSHFMREVGVWQALLVVTFGYFLAGIGTACMTPAFFSAASWIGNSPAAVTLSRMSMVNHVFIWNGKLLIAGIAGAFGMQVALLIPALLMLITVALAKYVRPPKGIKV